MSEQVKQVAWTVREWRTGTKLGHTTTHKLIGTGELPSAKVLNKRLILESPSDFLARHREPAASNAS